MSDFMRHNAAEVAFSSSESWVILSPIEMSIKKKIESVGVPLKDWDINIYRGVLTGYNEAFIISTDKRNEILANCQTDDERRRTEELIRPILRGRDIKRYGYEDSHLYLINTHNGIKGKLERIHIEDYPAVKAHLDQYWDKISTRADKGDTPFNLRNCAYLDDFSKPKIAWAETMRIKKSSNERFPRFSFINIPFFTDKTCFICCGKKLEYLTGILNSSITRYQLSKSVSMMDNGGYLMQKIYIEQIRLPIASPQIEAHLKSIIESGISNINENTENEIDKIAFDLFGFTAEEKDFLLKTIG